MPTLAVLVTSTRNMPIGDVNYAVYSTYEVQIMYMYNMYSNTNSTTTCSLTVSLCN